MEASQVIALLAQTQPENGEQLQAGATSDSATSHTAGESEETEGPQSGRSLRAKRRMEANEGEEEDEGKVLQKDPKAEKREAEERSEGKSEGVVPQEDGVVADDDGLPLVCRGRKKARKDSEEVKTTEVVESEPVRTRKCTGTRTDKNISSCLEAEEEESEPPRKRTRARTTPVDNTDARNECVETEDEGEVPRTRTRARRTPTDNANNAEGESEPLRTRTRARTTRADNTDTCVETEEEDEPVRTRTRARGQTYTTSSTDSVDEHTSSRGEMKQTETKTQGNRRACGQYSTDSTASVDERTSSRGEMKQTEIKTQGNTRACGQYTTDSTVSVDERTSSRGEMNQTEIRTQGNKGAKPQHPPSKTQNQQQQLSAQTTTPQRLPCRAPGLHPRTGERMCNNCERGDPGRQWNRSVVCEDPETSLPAWLCQPCSSYERKWRAPRPPPSDKRCVWCVRMIMT